MQRILKKIKVIPPIPAWLGSVLATFGSTCLRSSLLTEAASTGTRSLAMSATQTMVLLNIGLKNRWLKTSKLIAKT